MNRKSLTVLLGLTAALVMAGTDSNTDILKAEEVFAEEEFAEEVVFEDESEDYYEEEEVFEEVELEPITPSEYLIADPGQYVTPTAYEGLEVVQYVYEVTDDLINDQIQSELEMYGEEVEVDRASQSGDTIYVDMTYSVQGSEEEPYTESTYYYIGYEELGAEFDEQLTGASVGDTLKFSLSFDDSVYMEEWIDQTVDFEIVVTSICELVTPEYNDEYAQEYMGYDTIEEYEEDLRASITSEYEEMSYTETVDTLFYDAIDQAVFSGYPQELYDTAKEEVVAVYQSFADSFGMESFYELFDMTEEDIDAEVLDTVNRRLFTSWICSEHDIEVTEDEYVSYITEYAEYYGYENAAQFEADYTRASIVWSLYESKVGELLYDSASITEEVYTEDEAALEDLEYLDEEETE